jgi:hypothetical protein
MKRSFSILVVVALSMFTVLTTNAQKSSSFAGTIKISIKYEGENRNPQKHVPKEQFYTIFGNKMKVQDGPWWVYLYDGDAVTLTRLLDIPGNRGGCTHPTEVVEDFLGLSTKKFTYKKGEETKTICGYVCTRYDITIYDTETEEEIKAIAYTTTEIGKDNNINNFEYPGLTGFPLYVESEEKGVKTIEEAIEVKPTKVKAVDFLIPTNYKMMTPMEFNAYLKALNKRDDE